MVRNYRDFIVIIYKNCENFCAYLSNFMCRYI